MKTPVHETTFRHETVRTFVHRGQRAWLLKEIERALDLDTTLEFTTSDGYYLAPIKGDDFEILNGDEAAALSEQLGGRLAENEVVTVLYESGLTLVTATTRAGRALRHTLLSGTKEALLAPERNARLERRILDRVRLFEQEDRARKTRLLRCLVENARVAGPLAGRDADYALALAIVAEVATGEPFPIGAPNETRLADELSVPVAHITSALDALNEEKETP